MLQDAGQADIAHSHLSRYILGCPQVRGERPAGHRRTCKNGKLAVSNAHGRALPSMRKIKSPCFKLYGILLSIYQQRTFSHTFPAGQLKLFVLCSSDYTQDIFCAQHIRRWPRLRDSCCCHLSPKCNRGLPELADVPCTYRASYRDAH